MKIEHLARGLALATAAGFTALMLLPPRADGYSLLGGALRLPQIDVRVCDNFTDPESNDNAQEDPSFPGASGAELAIWKAAVEWGSEAHGDGLGDPTQPMLGSGAANFDFSWQGLASSVGAPNENIVSQISGQNGGVYAFTETPISDGWRIRFYQNSAVWQDGPGDVLPGSGNRDIQGVATHELGHALGLGHSGDLDATMISFLVETGVHFRSIEADDIAGVQAIYGARSPGKPRVSSYEVQGSSLTVRGSGFASAENEVWFTNRSALADGTPFKVAGLPSLDNGTRIQLTVPVEAGPGDLLVRRPGPGGACLSNAFPFDPAQAPCPPVAFFGTPKVNSQGGFPALHTNGRPTLRTNDFAIGTAGGIPGNRGYLISGAARAALPFQGGTLWVSLPIRREHQFQFDFFGGVDCPVPVTGNLVGSTRSFQIWYEDPADPFGVGLSDAVEVTFCP
ncbi:MAG: matrixin family metalloprotease [Planctomycetota bacterium]